MTVEIGIVFGLLTAMAYFFFTEKLPIEVTAFSGLVVLVLAGFVPANVAFDGFKSPAVITMLSIFFLSAALLHTGVADGIGRRAETMLGSHEGPMIATIMLVAALLSGFMNNIAATAVLLPAVMSIAQRTGIPPSRLFMPLSFGAILGGTTTLIGTPPNILVAEMLREADLEPFGFFDFTPVGLALIGVGTVYMLLVRRRLLPETEAPSSVSHGSDLVQVYRLHASMFSIRIPSGSALDGRRLRETALSSTLGVQVVGVLRGGRQQLAPDAESVLLAGDVLLVQGSADDVRELFRVRGAELAEAEAADLAAAGSRVEGIVARVKSDAAIIGKTLRELRFRERFGGIVIGADREGEPIPGDFAAIPLAAGDQLLVTGTRWELAEEELRGQFEISPMGPERFRRLAGRVFVVRVNEGSGLVGQSIPETRLGELVGLTISGILRNGDAILAVDATERILAGDRILVTGEPGRMRDLLALGNVELLQDVGGGELESDRVGLVEATLAPRSAGAGRTLAELRFRDRFGLQVLALWREGALIHERIANLPLRFGDALLVQGPWKAIRVLAADRDYVVLSSSVQEERRTSRAPVALGAFALMIGMVVSGWQPIHVASFTAATFVVLTRTISMEEAYRAVEWRAVFLVAAILPVGVAMEQTGAARLLADTVLALAGPWGPLAVLAGLVILSSALSQALDGAPAVVLLTPVALATAAELGVSPRPILMAIGLAASAAFMTPFSHKANLLVMGAGGYRVMDYVKVGTPLTIVVLGLIVGLVPLLFPF